MTYNIPEDLHPYLQYIPDDMLPDVITEALRSYIFAEPEVMKEEQPAFDINQLVALLQNQCGDEKKTEVVKKLSKAVTEPSDSKVGVICASIESDEDIPDDLRDVVGDFAGMAFK